MYKEYIHCKSKSNFIIRVFVGYSVVVDEDSDFQNIKILHSESYGNILVLDDDVSKSAYRGLPPLSKWYMPRGGTQGYQ